MKVKSNITISAYYPLKKGEEYEVYGIVYFATPFYSDLVPTSIDTQTLRPFVDPIYSYGYIRSETAYIIKVRTESGRLTLARYNVANFSITDAHVPPSWSTVSIDLHAETLRVRNLYRDHKNEEYKKFDTSLKMLKSYNAVAVVTAPDKLHDPQYLFDVCDDNLDKYDDADYDEIFQES